MALNEFIDRLELISSTLKGILGTESASAAKVDSANALITSYTGLYF
jgi:hypothetical protein